MLEPVETQQACTVVSARFLIHRVRRVTPFGMSRFQDVHSDTFAFLWRRPWTVPVPPAFLRDALQGMKWLRNDAMLWP